jgi:hypothetical protein
MQINKGKSVKKKKVEPKAGKGDRYLAMSPLETLDRPSKMAHRVLP